MTDQRHRPSGDALEAEVRRLSREGMKVGDIARITGMHPTLIVRILVRESLANPAGGSCK